jgi:hypothetical protein
LLVFTRESSHPIFALFLDFGLDILPKLFARRIILLLRSCVSICVSYVACRSPSCTSVYVCVCVCLCVCVCVSVCLYVCVWSPPCPVGVLVYVSLLCVCDVWCVQYGTLCTLCLQQQSKLACRSPSCPSVYTELACQSPSCTSVCVCVYVCVLMSPYQVCVLMSPYQVCECVFVSLCVCVPSCLHKCALLHNCVCSDVL